MFPSFPLLVSVGCMCVCVLHSSWENGKERKKQRNDGTECVTFGWVKSSERLNVAGSSILLLYIGVFPLMWLELLYVNEIGIQLLTLLHLWSIVVIRDKSVLNLSRMKKKWIGEGEGRERSGIKNPSLYLLQRFSEVPAQLGMAILSLIPGNLLLWTFLMQNFNLGMAKISVNSKNPLFLNPLLPKTSVLQ